MATKMFRAGENDIQGIGERAAFAEFGVGQVEEEFSGVFSWLMGGYREDRGVIPGLHSERMRGNSCDKGNSNLT